MTKTARTEGPYTQRRQTSQGWTDDKTLSPSQVSSLIAKHTATLKDHLQRNAGAYANATVPKGSTSQPRQIISSVGFTDHPLHFSWSYFPAPVGQYKASPNNKMRPWAYVFFHSFGPTWDAQYMKDGNRLLPPGDQYGHHPTRWFAGINWLVKQKPQGADKSSIHFCVSRRGDVVVSVDLNDIAYHGGGDFKIHPWGTNYVTIGIELEPLFGRKKKGGGWDIMDYSEPQVKALAVLCKKFTTIRPLAEVVISKYFDTPVLEQIKQHTSGYIQHIDVFSKKRDARGQFAVDPKTGKVGTGWAQLWGYMKQVRKFNLATDIFVDKIQDPDFSQIQDLAQAMQKGTFGQKMAAGVAYHKYQGLRRAAEMQAHTRQTHAQKGVTNAASLSSAASRQVAAVSAVMSRTDASSAPALEGGPQYDFDSGTWQDGKAQ